MCWYLTAQQVSCQQHCGSHGGYDSRTASYVGSPGQGGSLANCGQLLPPLGYPAMVTEGSRSDGKGLGCHIFGTTNWWLDNPDFSPSASIASAKIVCACLQ
jgi:hypothetical protein